MIFNYLKIALRNIKKYMTYSFINITGLAIGMACVILILLFIQDELSYDRFHEKADRIYRVVDSFNVPGGFERDFAFTSAPFAPTLKQDFPEVEDAVRLLTRRHMVTYDDKKYFEDFLFYADASVGSIFALLSKEFAILVLLANIFAWPTAYLLTQKWLQNFAYRVPMEPWLFVLAAVLAFVIALVTVSFQAMKAALANPVESLRYE